MIPDDPTILDVFSKTKAATVTQQMKAVVLECTAFRDGKMILFLYASKKKESPNFHQRF